MRQTKFVFQLRVPVVDAASARSNELDRLLEVWKKIPGAIAFNVECLSRPRPNSEDMLFANLDVTVTIESETAKGLRMIYDMMTEKISGKSVLLSGRACTITDLYD